LHGKTVSITMLALLIISTLALAYNIQPVRANGTISIRANGSIDPPTPNITTLDNTTYTFTGNIIGELIDVERGNIVIDGNGCSVQGIGNGNGFTVDHVNNVTIKNMNIANFSSGISIENSNSTFVTEDNITYCSNYGVSAIFSNNSTVSTSNVTSCSYGGGGAGIFSDLSNYTVFSYNNVSDNNVGGIKMWSGLYNAINGNTVTGNNGTGIDIRGPYNAINGNTVTGNNGTGIYIQGSSSDLIEDNTVIGNLGVGISISGSPNEEMNNNTVNDNNNGVWLDTCDNALVNGSILCGNHGTGIILESSEFGNVTSNQILDNTVYGIWLDQSREGSVQGNRLENSTIGIEMIAVRDFFLTDNYIANQSDCAIWMGIAYVPSYSNSIYHNEFVDNKNLVHIEANSGASWNDVYPSGGNYWSDYTGNDTEKGPYQNITGQDGIGDTPYVIAANVYDYYPLSPFTQPSHDIGILNPEQWKTVVFQGFPLCTYGSIINYGNNDENVSIIAYANGVPFDSKNSTLQAKTWNTTGFTFTSSFGWNTTGLVKYVNYSLSFYASPVAGETDKADNNFTGGWVFVSIVGDLTGGTSNVWDFVPDGKCDGKDVSVAARCFGGYPGCSPPLIWNANCDITGLIFGLPDGQVDGRDIALVARHFGEYDP